MTLATHTRAVAHDPAAPALVLSNVSVRYDNVVALDGVSFALGRGEKMALVGPNGAGKSTLFNVIAGVVRPDQGSVQVYGSQPGRHICVGYVPQHTRVAANFPVTVRDVVLMGRAGRIGLLRWPSRGDWSATRAAMDRVGIGPLAQRQIGELSGGQQQRVFLARALAQEAEILLMDEPLTGLDVPSQEAILETLDDLRSEGITIIVATHDLNQAAARFPVVALLNRRLIGIGSPPQVLTADHLMHAFGSHVHVVHTPEGDVLVADTCCDEEHPVATVLGRADGESIALPAIEVSVDGERRRNDG